MFQKMFNQINSSKTTVGLESATKTKKSQTRSCEKNKIEFVSKFRNCIGIKENENKRTPYQH